MIQRFLQRLTFSLERFILRGAFHQLLVVSAVILLISLAAGTVVYLSVPQFNDYSESVWWGFLRLSDPGYLGDDEGTIARVVSTVVTVLGYVVFLGALVAIMTQGLGRLMRRLESGTTPLSLKGHILVLGWTSRTESILRELLLSEGRMRRFLDRFAARKLKIVVLVEEVSLERTTELRQALGPLWDPQVVILRMGSPLLPEHLDRVDVLHASAIILPAGEANQLSSEALDARMIKTVLSISRRGEGLKPLPILTAELFDARKTEIARTAYRGDIALIPGATLISRLMAQTLRHPGLCALAAELLTHETGSEIYLRDSAAWTGRAFGDLAAYYKGAIPLGVLRPRGEQLLPLLNMDPDALLERGDRLVLLADSEDCLDPLPRPRESTRQAVAATVEESAARRRRRILLLGWSRKLPALLDELQSYTEESFSLTVASRVPEENRREFIERYAGATDRVEVSHLQLDYALPRELEALDPGSYDNVILLAGEGLHSGEDPDSRTLSACLLLQSLLPREGGPEVLVELIDPDNQDLLADRPGERIVSPQILSHMLAQVTLRRDLWTVFEELFTVGGAEIDFVPVEACGLPIGQALHFSAIREQLKERRSIALGLQQRRKGRRQLALNPADTSRWVLEPGDRVVILGRYEATI